MTCVEDAAEDDNDSKIEILDKAPPKFAKKENSRFVPSTCPSDASMDNMSLSEAEDSDAGNSRSPTQSH